MRVMVVDDEPLIRRSLQRVFQMAKHEVMICEDGQQAIDCWSAFNPEVAVLDVLMPLKTGPEVIEAVRPAAHVGIIFISAYTGEYTPESARKLGADLFIGKPFADIKTIVAEAEVLYQKKRS